MAKRTEKVTAELKVDDKGTIKNTQKKVKGLSKEMEKTGNMTNKTKRNLEGLAQRSGSTGKDFSRMSQGMGGLVAAYATVAANVFALSTAFNLLKRSADFDSMIVSSKNLSAATGNDFLGIAKSVQKATGSQIDYSEALAVTNKAVASGIGADKLAEFTTLATKAAQTFGGTTTDALNRMTDAVLRGRTELVNKLGIVISADEAYKNYGATINKSAQELTSFEKRQAITNAIIEEGNKAIGQTVIDTNPFEVLAVTFRDLGQDIFSFFTKTDGYLTVILNSFNESKVAALGLSSVVIGSVLKSLRASDDEMRRRRTAARKMSKRSESQVRVQGKKLNKINEQILQDRLAADKRYAQDRLKVFAIKAEKLTPKEKLSNLKSFDAAMKGEELSKQQIAGARKALANATKGIGALKDVPVKVRQAFSKELDFMEGKAGTFARKIRGHTANITNSFSLLKNNVKQLKNTWNASLVSMQRQYAVASTKIARKGLFTALPANMSFMAKTAARVTGAFNKFVGSLGTIGLLLAVGTAAWEAYSNKFRKHEKRLDTITELNKEFRENQKTLNATLESSSDKFKNLLTSDTTSAFQQKATIIGNNIASIVAQLKNAKRELSETANLSADKNALVGLEIQIKEQKKLVKEARQAFIEAGSPKEYSVRTGPKESNLVTPKELKQLREAESTLKLLLRTLDDSKTELNEVQTKAAESLRNEAKIAFNLFKDGALSKIREDLGKGEDDELPKKVKKQYEAAKAILDEILIVNIEEPGSLEKIRILIDKMNNELSASSSQYLSVSNSMKVMNEAGTQLGLSLRKTNQDMGVLGKVAETTWNTIFTEDREKEIKNIADNLEQFTKDGKNNLENLKDAMNLSDSLKTSKVIKEYYDLRDVLSSSAEIVITTTLSKEALEQNLQYLAINKESTKSSEKMYELDLQRVAILSTINTLEQNIVSTKIEALSKLKLKKGSDEEKAVLRELAALKVQLDILKQGRDITTETNKNIRTRADLDRKIEDQAKAILDIKTQELDLISKLIEEQQGSIALDIAREKRKQEDIKILQKEAKLRADLQKARKIEILEDRLAAEEQINAKLALLEIEKDILETRRAGDFRNQAQEGFKNDQSTQGFTKNLALSFQADIIDSINKADESISKLATSFKEGIRNGISTLLQGIVDGNASLRDAISAMGDTIAGGLVEFFTDNITKSLMQVFGVKDDATIKHQEAQDKRNSIITYLSQIATNTAIEPIPTPVSQGILNPQAKVVETLPEPDVKDKGKSLFAEAFKKDAKEQDKNTSMMGMLGDIMGGLGNGIMGLTQAVLGNTAQLAMQIVDWISQIIAQITSTTTNTVGIATNTAALAANTAALISSSATSAVGGFPLGANGGVMSDKGFTPLANGGIATKAQPYIIGEGRKNEAVVPLPNNREIPVVMQGDSGGDTIVNNYDFRNADATTEARIRGMIEANGAETFNKVYKEMDRGGSFAKRAGRRR